MALNEQISEEQVLGGMLVHSADNFADLLATWDAGGIPAFVAKMNAEAVRLGMDHSHFADPSGVSPGSESTASDLLKVATLDMADPTFASMVQMSSITLPLAGTISTYTPLLGLQGVIGVKSGYTSQAGGGDVLAVDRTVDGKSVLLLAAVTGQTGPIVLAQAGLHALALVDAVAPLIGTTQVLREPGRGPRQRGRPPSRGHDHVLGLHAHVARGQRHAVFVPSRHVADSGSSWHAGRDGPRRRRDPEGGRAGAAPEGHTAPDASPAALLTA